MSKQQSFAAAFVFAALLGSTALNAQSVKISPGYTSIGVNQTLQYKAAVTGLTPETVTWKINNITGGNSTYGTITTAGLYTAPATIPAAGIVVEAFGSDNKTVDMVYVNVAPAGPTITSISPTGSLPNGSYTVTLTGSGFVNDGTTRVLDGNIVTGCTVINATTLKASGWHGGTGPSTFQIQNSGTLWGPPLTVNWVAAGPPPPQAIAPTTASVNLGATLQFTSAGATSWSATAGSISTGGLFTAPASMPASATVTVKATGPGGTASAIVTLINPNPQIVAPATVSVNLGATQQFTSTGATSWTSKYGTITAAGLYTAPSTLPAATDTVSATGPNGVGTATVTLVPPTPVITSVGANNQIPLGIFSTTIAGTGFIPQSTASLNGTPLTVTYSNGNLNVGGFYGHSGGASIVVTNAGASSQPFTVQVGVSNALVSSAAARRFLEQAAFGPTPTDAAHVQQIGFQAWLTEQFAMAPVSNYNVLAGSSQGGLPTVFLANAVTNPDQLRQRVAFALSQIFVVSINKIIWNGDMIPYEQMLLADAFTNYGQILGDVTLSPAMGEYLDMANNAKANPAAGTVANENFAREIMQLFTIGTKMLNPDGTVQTNASGPIPTYGQTDVTELARTFTGWTYAGKNGGAPVWGAYINSCCPMMPFQSQHDFGPKNFLGNMIQQNLSPQADLQGALTILANHPNTAPFISKQLIQHLVKSNPSPAYVQRVVNAWLQSQGDMKAVITAILLDAEARANDEGGNDQSADGHFQEPALLIAGVVRAFGGQMTPQNYYASTMATMGEDIYNAPSVFNYFSPGYVAGNTGGLFAPELQIDNPNSAILRENFVASLFNQYSNPIQSYGPGTTIDLSPLLPLAATPSTLVDAIDLTLTHGVMPSALKQTIVNAVSADAGGNLHRVETAIYLTLVSSYYNVWH